MTLSLELTSQEEARLARAAQSQGMDITKYARMLLGLEHPDRMPPSVEEWDAALDELAQDVDSSIPPLSDEALSRRSIYGHRA
jgi:hypothetical protein